MKNLRKFCIVVAILAQGCLIFAGNLVTAAEPATATCRNCHDDLAALLPKNHAPVEDNVASCLACHRSNMPGMEKKNPFLTRIHLAHQPPRGDGDCLTCHTWSAGKSFGLLDAPESWGAPTQQDMQVLKGMSWADGGTGEKNRTRRI